MTQNKTIAEMLDEARKQSGAAQLAGHDIMALERFDPTTTHMVIFDVLTRDSPIGFNLFNNKKRKYSC